MTSRKRQQSPFPSGQAVQVRFQLMPTAYTFAKVHIDLNPFSETIIRFKPSENLHMEVPPSICAPAPCEEMAMANARNFLADAVLRWMHRDAQS